MAELTSTNVYGKLNVTRELQVTPQHSLKDSADRPGLLEIEELQAVDWNGIQLKGIDGQLWSFMASTTSCGIYDDTNSDWHILCSENGQVELYHNGSKKLSTISTGIDVTGNIDLTGNIRSDAATTRTFSLSYTDEDLAILGVSGSGGSLQILDGDGPDEIFGVTPTTVTVNEGSKDVDFRIESNGRPYMLFVDGGNNFIGLNEITPNCTLDASGTIRSTGKDVPAQGSGMEMYWNGNPVGTGTGHLLSYSRTLASYQTMQITASQINFYAGASPTLAFSATTDGLVMGSTLKDIDVNGADIFDIDECRYTSNATGVKDNWENASAELYSAYYDDTPNTWELRNGVATNTGGTVIFQVDFDTGLTRAANDIVAYYSFSDERLKNNIKNIGYVSDKLMDLEPITFNWKDTTVDVGTHFGFIAQQAEKIFPETVVEDLLLNDGKTYKRIRYDEYAPILTKAFQEQQEKIKKQDKTIRSLEDKINKLEKLIQDKIK